MARAKSADKETMTLSFSDKVKELEKKYSKPQHDRMFIPTGSVGYDWALGGGYQTGRIYEKIAWEGAGKTTLSLHAVAECQKMGENALYIDAEHALDRKYAEAIGVDWNALAKFQPSFGEEGFEYTKDLIATGDVRLVIIDSTSGMLPKKQMLDPAGASNLGLHAKLLGTEIPKVVNLADIYNCVVIFISQFREKIGVMFGSPETTQGGNALKFWASVRTEFRRGLSKEGDEVVGIDSKFKVIKNKVVSPYRTGVIPIRFGEGINKVDEMIDLGGEYDVIRKFGKNITLLDNGASGETKYLVEEFISLWKTDDDFRYSINSAIKQRMDNDSSRIELDKTEAEGV